MKLPQFVQGFPDVPRYEASGGNAPGQYFRHVQPTAGIFPAVWLNLTVPFDTPFRARYF